MCVFDGSKTKRKSDRSREAWSKEAFQKQRKDLVNSEQLEKVTDLKDGKLTKEKRVWARRKFRLRGKG